MKCILKSRAILLRIECIKTHKKDKQKAASQCSTCIHSFISLLIKNNNDI